MDQNNSNDIDVVKVTMFFHHDPKYYPFLMPPSIAGWLCSVA